MPHRTLEKHCFGCTTWAGSVWKSDCVSQAMPIKHAHSASFQYIPWIFHSGSLDPVLSVCCFTLPPFLRALCTLKVSSQHLLSGWSHGLCNLLRLLNSQEGALCLNVACTELFSLEIPSLEALRCSVFHGSRRPLKWPCSASTFL